MKPFLIALLLVAALIQVKAQAPPAMSMPNAANKALVDSIIKITNHEQYVVNYCTKKINEYAKANSWPDDKTNKVVNSIQFRYYFHTIYNSYADYSTDELTKLLQVLTEISREPKDRMGMILTNQMMQSNLDLFVRSLIAEKYVKK